MRCVDRGACSTAISQAQQGCTVTSNERLPETGGRLIPWQTCLINIPPKAHSEETISRRHRATSLSPGLLHPSGHFLVLFNLALPWLAGTEQAVSKGASIYFIPMGHVERADFPRNVDGGLVVAPGSLRDVAETHELRRGVPD